MSSLLIHFLLGNISKRGMVQFLFLDNTTVNRYCCTKTLQPNGFNSGLPQNTSTSDIPSRQSKKQLPDIAFLDFTQETTFNSCA